MTETERKALALVNEVRAGYGWPPHPTLGQRIDCSRTEALCRAIEQHEAFRQEVSDAVEKHKAGMYLQDIALDRFIIAKPDPLVEVMNEMGFGWSKTASEEFRAAIEKRGGKIVWGEG